MAVITTLGFAGRTEEALRLLSRRTRRKDRVPDKVPRLPVQSHTKPGMEDLIFHAAFQIDGSDFMATEVGFIDTDTPAEFSGFSLLLRFDSTDERNVCLRPSLTVEPLSFRLKNQLSRRGMVCD